MTAESKQPQFASNLVVAHVSLVTDSHGNAWWVDPVNKTLNAAESKLLTRDDVKDLVKTALAEIIQLPANEPK